MNIANRDIKLENALLDSNNSAWPLLRLCDFGYSINETMSLAQSRVGTQVSLEARLMLLEWEAAAAAQCQSPRRSTASHQCVCVTGLCGPRGADQ